MFASPPPGKCAAGNALVKAHSFCTRIPIPTLTHWNYETNTWSLDTGSLLRLHFSHRTFRLRWLGCRLVAARVLRVPAHVLLLRGSSYVKDAARDYRAKEATYGIAREASWLIDACGCKSPVRHSHSALCPRD